MAELTKYDRYIVRQVLPFCDAVKPLGSHCLWKSEAVCALFWYRVNPRNRSKVGRRLYWLATHGYLPLRFVVKASDKASLYSVLSE